MLLWGVLGAAAPVLIHLMLRPRPRRQPFPAIRFVLQSREASERTNRLRRLLLLLMRMAAIACVAMLLAQPRVRAARWVPVDSGPISVAICFDDSASMAYRFEGKTRLDVAKEWAASLVNDRSRFGEDSEFVVLTAAPESGEPRTDALSTARNAILREIESVRQRAHDQPVGRMIRRADELLTKARHPRREIYVFSDSTLRAWRDVTGPPLALTSNAAVFCIDVGVEEDLNTALTLASVPKHAVPPDIPIRLELAVRTGRDGPARITPTIEVRVDDQPRLRCPIPPTGTDRPAGELTPGQTANVPVTLPGLAKGLHRLTIELSPSDPLSFDNVRYACVQAGTLPEVAVVSRDGGTDSAGTLVAAMLAPPALPEQRQRLRVARLAPGELGTAALVSFRCVFLADVPALDDAAWRNLAEYAHDGGAVITILGSAVQADRYEQGADLLPGMPGEIVDFQPPTHLAPVDLANPLLAPFANPGVDSLADRAILRAWTIRRMGNRAVVVAPLASGGPGLIERPVGAGRSILLTFSPESAWSEFAAKAAPMILLLHTAVATASNAFDQIATAETGAVKSVPIPPKTGPIVDVRFTSEMGDGQTARVNAAATSRRVPVPTNLPGHVIITPIESARDPLLMCAVNVADEESDLRRLAADEIAARFAQGAATSAKTSSQLGQVQRRQRVGVDAAIPAGIVLLTLLIVESAFANKFYKRWAPAERRG